MKPRTIIIEPVLNGFIIQVGCQRVVIPNAESLGQEIAKYYKDPSGTEEYYNKHRVNNTDELRPDAPRLNRGPECSVPSPTYGEACESPREPEVRGILR